MPKSTLNSPQAPAAVGPYAHAAIAGGWVCLSAQFPLDPATGQRVDGGIEAQTRRVLDNIKAVLQTAGLSMSDVVRVTVMLQDLADFQAMNAVYASYFPQNPPARSCFQAARLPKDSLVGMDAMAWAGGR